ncbi:HEAT repeat domain-containing protein, partial [Allorhizobium pseudoryzae]|uniref:HEAT repeat domain-containing protein n=1 Tax=Allorhizobium pseudoryzae TaxID=379684 RepID=UPI003D0351B9
CLAKARKPALAHHVHRAQRMGKGVLVSEDAYNNDSAAQAVSKLKSSDEGVAYRGVTDGFHLSEKSGEHVQTLRRLVESGSEPVRRWALMGLARTESPGLAGVFDAHLRNDHDPLIREWSAWAIGLNKLDSCRATLRRSLSVESNPRVREWIIKAAHQIGDPGLSTEASLISLYQEERDALVKEGIAGKLVAAGNIASISLLRSEFERLSDTSSDWSSSDRRLFSQVIKLFYHVRLSEDDRSCCHRLLESPNLDRHTKALIVNVVFCDVQRDDELALLRKFASGKDMLIEYILENLPIISADVVDLGREMERLMPTWRQNEYSQVGREGITFQTVVVETNDAKMLSVKQIALGVDVTSVHQKVEAARVSSIEQKVSKAYIDGDVIQTVIEGKE